MKNELLSYFGLGLHSILGGVKESFFAGVEEIRLRVGKPIIIYKNNKEYFVGADGGVYTDINLGYRPTAKEVNKTLELMCGYSLYAFGEEIKNGYITLQSGHRVGITGQVITENGAITGIKNINGLNLRVSHEVLGCSNEVIRYVCEPDLKHCMIISPPACGKTTLLRDIVRIVSDGYGGRPGQKVGVVDERSEIAGCYMGVAQNNIGQRTDVLDSCPKSIGMKMLLRSMSPRLIAVDEIGSRADIDAIDEVTNAGVKIICTVHGRDIDDLLKKPVLNGLLNKNLFELFIVLGYDKKPGKIMGVYGQDYKRAT
ncbi:MAG: stage III sporulation protein AA [Clostridiales bacterium]|jgi:stage III sporulation protein AA|nr:stage III sporulation protein AA [Clostridiales bacterium]